MPKDDKKGVLSGLNLPEIFGGRAGDALSRLVGVPVNAVAARLERGEANIVARTEGQVAFQKIVASAAAEQAIQNPEFMQRAVETFGRDLVEKQINKDKIAAKSILLLDQEIPEKEEKKSGDGDKVSIDWLNHYSSHAEKVSNDEMQNIWANILAGEIRKPGEFSLSTLRLLAETDSSTAELFTKRVDHVFGGSLICNASDPTSGKIDMELFKLDQLGFLAGVQGGLMKPLDFTNGVMKFFYEDSYFVIKGKEGLEGLNLPNVSITPAGMDLLKIVKRKPPSEFARHLVAHAPNSVLEIEIYSTSVVSGNAIPQSLLERYTP